MKISKLGILLLVLIINTGCELFKNDHELRITNNYPATISATVGDVKYDSIAHGSTSKYKSVGEGTHELSGNLKGSIILSGNGYHKWTLTVNSDGTFTFKKD